MQRTEIVDRPRTSECYTEFLICVEHRRLPEFLLGADDEMWNVVVVDPRDRCPAFHCKDRGRKIEIIYADLIGAEWRCCAPGLAIDHGVVGRSFEGRRLT